MASEAAQVIASEPSVMFVGSGISIPSPSDLPSAYGAASSFLRRVADGIVPSPLMDELLQRRGVLPEFVYGLAERHSDHHVYEVWRSLELWRSKPGVFSANAGHLAAVHVAVRWGTPVLTPNFDTFLEDAAEKLGLEPRVSVATPGQAFEPTMARAGEVAIWKLHGTSLAPGTIFSSVRTLTMPVTGLRERLRDAVPASTRLLLAGYSGRDLDLFPVLAAGAARKKPIWVDLHFDSDHRAQLLNPAAAQVVAPFDEVARLYALRCDGQLRAAVEASDRLARSQGHAALAAALKAQVGERFEQAAGALSKEAGRRLLLGELLINGGMSESALVVLRGANCDGASRSEQVRLMAKAEWELGHFRSSEAMARDRLRERTPAAERDILRFAVTAARMRAIVPPQGLEGTVPARRGEVIIIALHAGFSFLAAAPRALCPARIPEPTRTPLVETWVEHGIRLAATLQVFSTHGARSMPRPMVGVFVWVWKALRGLALRIGYAEGVGNSGRYLARLGVPDPDGIRAAHEFLGHFLGVSIAHRDAATRAIDHGDTSLAIHEYERGLEIARLQKDPVLLLTFVPLARRLGIPLHVERTAITGIEADWTSGYLGWLDRHLDAAGDSSD